MIYELLLILICNLPVETVVAVMGMLSPVAVSTESTETLATIEDDQSCEYIVILL